MTPNHALQRTAPRVTARAFCERSAIYIWAFFVRSTVGHAPRHAPPSLSLGSLGVATRVVFNGTFLPAFPDFMPSSVFPVFAPRSGRRCRARHPLSQFAVQS